MVKNNWVAWVAIIALVLAVVAVAIVLNGSVTGNAIFGNTQTSTSAESEFLFRATSFVNESGVGMVTIQKKTVDGWVDIKQGAKTGDVINTGDTQFKVGRIIVTSSRKSVAIVPMGSSYGWSIPNGALEVSNTASNFLMGYKN